MESKRFIDFVMRRSQSGATVILFKYRRLWYTGIVWNHSIPRIRSNEIRANITINVDDEQYRRFNALCQKFHLTPEIVLGLFVKAAANTGGKILELTQTKEENTYSTTVDDTPNTSNTSDTAEKTSLLQDLFGNIISTFTDKFLGGLFSGSSNSSSTNNATSNSDAGSTSQTATNSTTSGLEKLEKVIDLFKTFTGNNNSNN